MQKARIMRASGATYREISSSTGLSIDWCKRNLKDVTKGVQEDKCITELLALATRPEGVSVYEANGVIIKHNKDTKLSKDQLRYIRDKTKTKDPNSLFRPDWVSTKAPVDSYQAFCAYVLHMQDEVDNLVRWYCDSFPDTNPYSVKYELLEYLKPSKDSMSLSKRISKAEKTTEQMQQRMQDT